MASQPRLGDRSEPQPDHLRLRRLNRLISQTDPLGGTRLFGYDAVGNLTSLTDEAGQTTTFVYDEHDRLIQRTDPLGNF
jgi:YD repeat-containing protein